MEGMNVPAAKGKKESWQLRDTLKVEERPKGFFTKYGLMGLAALIAGGAGAKAGVDALTGKRDDGLMTTLASSPTPEGIERADSNPASAGGQQ